MRLADRSTQEGRDVRRLGWALIWGLGAYAVLIWRLGDFPAVVQEHTAWISVPMQVVGLMVGGYLVRRSSFPLSAFGWEGSPWRRDTVEALVMTAPWVAGCVVLKWVGMQWWPDQAGERLFAIGEVIQWHGWDGALAYLGLYTVMIGAQKWVIHGVVQSTIGRGVEGPGGRWAAIGAASMLFAVLHLHVSPWFALLAWPIGVFWGWLYERQRHLVGVTVSHVAVGWVVFFVVGLGWV